MSQRLINQSFVKASEKPDFCPKAYYETDVTKNFTRPTSDAMLKGKYFEYLATGAADRDGEIAEMQPTARGKLSVDQVRIEWQARQFSKNLEKDGIELVKVGESLAFNLFEEFLTTGILDTEVLYKGEPYIMDIKLTANIHNTYGDFSWGDFQSMDKLQAYTYTLLKYHQTGIKYGFIYYIADFKKNPEYKIEEVIDPLREYKEVYRRFRNAFLKHLVMEKENFPPAPSAKCEKCVVSTCQYVGTNQKLSARIWEDSKVVEHIRQMESAKRIREINQRVTQALKSKSDYYKEEYPII